MVRTALCLAALACAAWPTPCVGQDAVERIATGFSFVEGPVWDPASRTLRFSDIPNERILELGPDGTISTWLEPSGRSNGLALDGEGRLHACAGGGERKVVRFEADRSRTVLAESFDGKRLNSPNDLALDPDGGIWFTDPRYGDASNVEQDRMAVYFIAPGTGDLRRAVDDIARPNGILVSRDGSGLYVADPERRALRFYPILGPGLVGPGRDLFVGDPELDGSGPDGMALAEGRIYTTYAGVNVHALDGTLLRRIAIPERPANCAVGGDDLQTLFVTARTSLYRVRIDARGFTPFAAPTPSTVTDATGFDSQVLDPAIGVGYGVAVADVDGDRRPDVVLVDTDDVAWYRNPGSPDGEWTRHVVAHRLSGRLDHVCVAAADIDGDGRAELAAGAAWNPSDTEGSGSVHWLEPPDVRTGPWRAIALPHEPTVHRMRFVRTTRGFELVVAPLHGRGNVNSAGVGARILAYRRGDDDTWSTAPIATDLHVTHNIDPVQWDDDPADELLVAAREGVFVFDRGADGELWRRTAVVTADDDPSFDGAGEVRAGALPDGRRFVATVEPFHGASVCVYVPPEAGSPRAAWIRRVLPIDPKPQGHALAIGDVRGVGHDQVVFGWRNPDADGNVGILIFDPIVPAFRSCAVLRLSLDMACEDLRLADLDGDGDLDVVACGRATHDLRIFWNRGS